MTTFQLKFSIGSRVEASVSNLCRELDVAEASEKLFDCVVRDGVRPAQVREWLVLDRNQKVPDNSSVRSVKPKYGKFNLNWSARRDLTVLTYCFLSRGLIETSA